MCFEGDLCSEKRAAGFVQPSRLFFPRGPQELSLAFMTSILLAPADSVHSSTLYKVQKREADCSSWLVLPQDSCRYCTPRTSRECLRSFRPKLPRFKASGRIAQFTALIKDRHPPLSVRRGPPGVPDGINELRQQIQKIWSDKGCEDRYQRPQNRSCPSRETRGTAGLPTTERDSPSPGARSVLKQCRPG